MNIKSKLMLSYLLLIIFCISTLGFIIGCKSKDAIFNEVTEKSERIAELIENTVSVRNDLLSDKISSDLQFTKKHLKLLGELRLDNKEKTLIENFNVPSLYFGKTKLNLNQEFANYINESTKSVVTILLLTDNKLLRISTTLSKNNKRTIGTYIDNTSPIYKNIVSNKPYCGKNFLVDEWYLTRYEPILDKNKKVIGAIAVGGKCLNDYLENSINNINIGKTGYVYIINSKGDMLVHPNLKGKNLKDHYFFKKIVTSKNGLSQFNVDGVSKLAAFKYFEPWDWYIVVTANYNDLNSSSFGILKATLLTGLITFLIGLIISLFLANTFVRPINKLKSCIEAISNGDLSVNCDIKSNDEIGVLSTSFNKMVQENNRLLEETLQYDKLKTEFIANISHELRTPLNIIFSTAQLFSLYANTPDELLDKSKLNHYTSIMRQNCYRLLRLVNNLIDITKIDSGFMEVNLKNENIVEVVENITLSTAEYVESKGRTLIFDTDTEEKIMAFDPEKMERIVLNLISNATKFTKPGDTIEITISDKEEFILISVKDTGIGIPQDKLENIFERFKQVDSLLSRKHEGSGIGLSLIKSLVEMHYGSISVKSDLGKGSEFIVKLPVTLTSKPVEEEYIADFSQENNVEKIKIEFSDIYN